MLANEADGDGGDGGGALAAAVAKQTDQMRRLVDHHLTRARTAATGGVLGTRTEVAPVVADVARAVARIHAHRAIDIACDCPADLALAGEAQDLEEMVGNLLDNRRQVGAGAGAPDGAARRRRAGHRHRG